MSEFPSHYKSDATQSIGLSFIKVYNSWHKKIKDKLKDINLTHPQFVVLASLGHLNQKNSEVNQVDISKQSDIDVMTVSTIIRNLEKQKLVIRQNSLIDTRAKSVQLTKHGQKTLTKALPVVEAVDQEFFEKLGTKKEQLNLLLLKLLEE